MTEYNELLEMEREEKKKRQEAEGELTIIKGIGNTSPEMKVLRHHVLSEIGFHKKGRFPEKEREKIVKAVRSLRFKDFDDYKNNFESKLAQRLGNSYLLECQVFKNNRSRIKDSGTFGYRVDLYNAKSRIAIEVEKTKDTTLLLDVIKFVMGFRRKSEGKPIIEYGVLIIPDEYRNKNNPNGQGGKMFNRLHNELAFINSILWIKDILIIEYDTSLFFK